MERIASEPVLEALLSNHDNRSLGMELLVSDPPTASNTPSPSTTQAAKADRISVRRVLAAIIDPSRERELEERRRRARRDAHMLFHRLWSDAAGGAPYNKQTWTTLWTHLNVLGVGPANDVEAPPDPVSDPTGRSLPWLSLAGLGYVLVATLNVSGFPDGPGASPTLGSTTTLGYGVTQLGYVLLVAGVVSGRFGAFGLRSRPMVLAAGALAWIIGVVLGNLY